MHTGESLGGTATEDVINPNEDRSSVSLALTAGLAEGAKLRINRMLRFTPTGIEWDGAKPTEEQMRELFRMLKWIADGALPVWLADAIGKARQACGQDVANRLLVETEFSLDLAQKAIAIDSLTRDLRHPFLTAEHYWALAHGTLPGKAGQKLNEAAQCKWAELAVEHRLSARLLMLSISNDRVMTSEQSGTNSGRGSGLATPHGIRQAFDLWYGQVEFKKMDRDGMKQAYEELKPVAKVVRQLEEELAATESEVE